MSTKSVRVIFILVALLVISIVAIVSILHSDQKEDQTQSVDTNGSVETSVSVQHADSTHDVILTSHKVWLKGSEYRTVVHTDTIPALDSTMEEAENQNGDSKMVTVKKDYQIFITVK